MLGALEYNPPCLDHVKLSDGRILEQEGGREELRRVFGHDKFRPGQWAVITHAMGGKGNILMIKPTGAGKTLPIQYIGMVGQKEGYILIIVPTEALLLQQTATLRAHGAHVACPNADKYDGKSIKKKQQYWADIAASASFGLLDFLILSPERIVRNRFLKRWRSILFTPPTLRLVFIDEVHLVCSWGSGFRPMLNLELVGGIISDEVRMIGATATMTRGMIRDVCGALRFQDTATVFRDKIDRPNLRIEIFNHWNRTKKEVQVLLLNEMINGLWSDGGKAVVYTSTRKRCNDLFDLLKMICKKRTDGMIVKAKVYHSDSKGRPDIGLDWGTGALNVIIATTAFGMGVDTPDIRQVLFECCPFGVVGYNQQLGRGGRDGKLCKVRSYVRKGMFFKALEVLVWSHWREETHPETGEKRIVLHDEGLV